MRFAQYNNEYREEERKEPTLTKQEREEENLRREIARENKVNTKLQRIMTGNSPSR